MGKVHGWDAYEDYMHRSKIAVGRALGASHRKAFERMLNIGWMGYDEIGYYKPRRSLIAKYCDQVIPLVLEEVIPNV